VKSNREGVSKNTPPPLSPASLKILRGIFSGNVLGVYLVGSRRRKLFFQCSMDRELYFFFFILSLLSNDRRTVPYRPLKHYLKYHISAIIASRSF
jgi:hypothetical protein